MHTLSDNDIALVAAELSGVILSKQEYPFSPYQPEIYTLAADIYARMYTALQERAAQESSGGMLRATAA